MRHSFLTQDLLLLWRLKSNSQLSTRDPLHPFLSLSKYFANYKRFCGQKKRAVAGLLTDDLAHSSRPSHLELLGYTVTETPTISNRWLSSRRSDKAAGALSSNVYLKKSAIMQNQRLGVEAVDQIKNIYVLIFLYICGETVMRQWW